MNPCFRFSSLDIYLYKVSTRAANYMHAKLCLLTCNDRSLRRYFTYFTFYNNKRREKKNYIKTPDSGGLI